MPYYWDIREDVHSCNRGGHCPLVNGERHRRTLRPKRKRNGRRTREKGSTKRKRAERDCQIEGASVYRKTSGRMPLTVVLWGPTVTHKSTYLGHTKSNDPDLVIFYRRLIEFFRPYILIDQVLLYHSRHFINLQGRWDWKKYSILLSRRHFFLNFSMKMRKILSCVHKKLTKYVHVLCINVTEYEMSRKEMKKMWEYAKKKKETNRGNISRTI